VAPDREYSIAELGRDAIAVLDHVGVRKAHWCGLSKGGMVGMWLMVNAPERLDRVVLAHTAAKAHTREMWETRIATAREKGLEALVEPTIERWFTEGFRKASPATIEKIRRMILSTPVAGYCGCCAAIRDMDQTESIRAAKNPALVIIGAHDPATTPEAGKLIAERIPGARSVTIEAAHLGNVEAADDFNRAMIGFLTATS
jgi:3-oxoadipate enol-lactonase